MPKQVIGLLLDMTVEVKAYFVICEHGNVILDERNDLEEYKDRSIKC